MPLFDFLNWNIFNLGPAAQTYASEVSEYSEHMITAHQDEVFGLSHYLSLRGYIIDFNSPKYSLRKVLKVNNEKLNLIRKDRDIINTLFATNQSLRGRELINNSIDILNLDLKLKACAIDLSLIHI